METQNIVDRFSTWMKESITIKLTSIGILILILLIPSSWITGIMEERQSRANEVMEEVAGKWSGSQTLAGPVLVIPFTRIEKVEVGKDVEFRNITDYAFFLPASLKITSDIVPQVLHRGIFDVAVYESTLAMEVVFNKPDISALGVPPENVLWKESRIASGISDLRGITETPAFIAGGKQLVVEPTNNIRYAYYKSEVPASGENDRTLSSGVEALLDWTSEADFQGDVNVRLSLKGSSVIRFLPMGKSTEVTLRGPWPNPSFEGEFLPNTRVIDEKGFEATWKVLHFNRPFSQEWVGDGKAFEKYDLGARLIIPADQYQKSIRTAKYGILLIILSFTALLMVEIIKKFRIHPFQYILIGAALIVYYSLLISLSEHLGYDLAYLVAAVATVTLITLYARSFLYDRRLLILLSGLITFFYIFIFVIIQAQDFSLLIGSIGLFFVIASIMYFSRSINWYGEPTRK